MQRPFYGEVSTLYQPLACYRIHYRNLYAMNAIDSARFAAKSHTFELKVNYLAQRCRNWEIPFDPSAALNGLKWTPSVRPFGLAS